MIKKGDNVYVLTGKDKGKKGRIEKINPSLGVAVVAGINTVIKHQKPKQGVRQVGRITKPMPIKLSNLALVCEKCGKHVRMGYKILENGDKTRICRKCGDII